MKERKRDKKQTHKLQNEGKTLSLKPSFLYRKNTIYSDLTKGLEHKEHGIILQVFRFLKTEHIV